MLARANLFFTLFHPRALCGTNPYHPRTIPPEAIGIGRITLPYCVRVYRYCARETPPFKHSPYQRGRAHTLTRYYQVGAHTLQALLMGPFCLLFPSGSWDGFRAPTRSS